MNDKELSQSKRDVLNALKSSPVALSRYEVGVCSGRRLSTVCGRINELLAAGMVEVVGRKQDQVTKKQVELLAIVKDKKQLELV